MNEDKIRGHRLKINHIYDDFCGIDRDKIEEILKPFPQKEFICVENVLPVESVLNNGVVEFYQRIEPNDFGIIRFEGDE